MSNQGFLFFECTNNDCRFRYPATVESGEDQVCPRCGNRVNVVGTSLKAPNPQSNAKPAGPEWVGILDNIRSIHNTGSMFRTADGAGFSHLYLCGITATPDHPRLAKAALGSQNTVGWTYTRNGVDLANRLLEGGYRLLALERLYAPQNDTIEGLTDSGYRVALVVGNEKAGIDPGILSLCDCIVSLPMIGQKSSLNVAVAFGIAAYVLRFGSSMLAGR